MTFRDFAVARRHAVLGRPHGAGSVKQAMDFYGPAVRLGLREGTEGAGFLPPWH